jgi:hypothetical protein
MQNLHPVDNASHRSTDPWPRPSFEVISLDCEITSYAPDDGDPRPLF